VHRLSDPWRSAAQILALTVAWTVFQLAVVMPVLEHLTGRRQDLSDFSDLQGNAALLVALLVVSWTVAAVGEEVVYRGYLFTRVTDIVGPTRLGVVLAVLVTSALFGFAHTEQGVIGVAVTFLDAIFFCALRLRYRTVWASVLGHGFNNTIGLTAFFLVGPIYGLW
jgi:membrane protease YdiL (CAAX protease family)